VSSFWLFRKTAVAAAGVLLALVAGTASAQPPRPASPGPPLRHFYGSVHNHTAYSDGEGRPEDAFAAGKEAAFNFLFVTEHSEWHEFPFKANPNCLLEPTTLPDCAAFPPPGKTQWQNVADQGAAASDPTIPYLGLRGFEWSSPTLGHVGVLLSTHPIGHGPFAPTMDAFWEWFLLDESLGGGGDGLAVFNHPSRERHPIESLRTFEDFRYVSEADERTVGLEVFNRSLDYSACYARALSKGWHVGAIGAADNHDDWGRLDRSLTALVVDNRRFENLTEEAVREALLSRRFYATFDHNLRVSFKGASQWMGARLERVPGKALDLSIDAEDPDPGDTIARIEIYSSDVGEPVCDRDAAPLELTAEPLAAAEFDSEKVSFETEVIPPPGAETWYFAKVIQADGDVAYTSPIWVSVP
jgi:hypothetical protein